VKAKCLFAFVGVSVFAIIPLLSAATYSEGAPGFTRISAPVSIPAEMSGHTMFVDVMVNGQGPFHMLVDTGCSVTLVSPELAAAAKAVVPEPDDDQCYGQNGLGDLTSVRRLLLESIVLGGARFEGVTACVSDTFDLLSKVSGRRVDGVLGFPLFADLFVGFDFPHRRLLLSDRWPEAIPQIRAELPVVEHADVPFVLVRVQGQPMEAMIDTGSNKGLQLPSGMAPTMNWKDQPRPGSLVAVIGEVGRDWIGRLAGTLRLGKLRQAEPATCVSSGPPSIGVGLLENFCVVFHQSENRVWLCSDDTKPIPSPVEYSIGLSLVLDLGGWRVAGIIPGSPAEGAHLNTGQLVTRIEGRPSRDWTRDQIQQWIDSHNAVALAVADASGEHNISLRVWSLVP
jgi:predicted aspartyl protease